MVNDVETDWTGWLRRWDRQQEGYVPEREARFTAMFDAVEALLPEEFVALDLGAGPGSLSGAFADHERLGRGNAILAPPTKFNVPKVGSRARTGRI